ncbi:MAG TPA: transketolase C-terminal domain-containing protein [Acidobacteriaceae bacterium]|nr:transketolase C-terminal domain-containing protein [Acidobacteriaceae bacterium]
MKNASATTPRQESLNRESFHDSRYAIRQGMLKLLAIKDSDVRLLTLEQCRDAVDKGLHAGGAFSATIPLVALFYGGFLHFDVEDPTRRGQDMFTLSKGHAVAALASIYAELGYFDRKILKNSRSFESILNGHPGPVLPGVHIATGPMGQGFGVAQGLAIAGRVNPLFDSYCMVGDGELQEGPIWEAVMYAGQGHLDNFCLLVDRNNGQLDIHSRMVFPMPELEAVFRSFGWKAHNVDATQYDGVYAALEDFRFGPRDGKPTAIICNGRKGFGSFSDFLNKHKVTMSESLIAQEYALQSEQREARVNEFLLYCRRLGESAEGEAIRDSLLESAHRMHLEIDLDSSARGEVRNVVGPVLTRRAPQRDKRIRYDSKLLPQFDPKKEYAASDVVTAAMKVFARDPAVVSIDADLGSTSGLESGIAYVDQKRALNVGVAEANMMLIGEAFAALGYNTWVSTFCPFFDWKVLRRIAVGYQERMEAMEAPDGWLSEGHGLDLTFLATAANFETRTNGATHMGNDDNTTFDAVGHLKIIDVSCPQQMLAIMKWIMEGNRGLVYLRVMRTGSAVLYGGDYSFAFGAGYRLRSGPEDQAILISSGRGVHEALAAAERCGQLGLRVGVVDMPSIDENLLIELYNSGKLLVFAEQNNGYLWQNFLKVLYRCRGRVTLAGLSQVVTINTLDADGRPQFIHSGTYEELIAAFHLTPDAIARTIQEQLAKAAR